MELARLNSTREMNVVVDTLCKQCHGVYDKGFRVIQNGLVLMGELKEESLYQEKLAHESSRHSKFQEETYAKAIDCSLKLFKSVKFVQEDLTKDIVPNLENQYECIKNATGNFTTSLLTRIESVRVLLFTIKAALATYEERLDLTGRELSVLVYQVRNGGRAPWRVGTFAPNPEADSSTYEWLGKYCRVSERGSTSRSAEYRSLADISIPEATGNSSEQSRRFRAWYSEIRESIHHEVKNLGCYITDTIYLNHLWSLIKDDARKAEKPPIYHVFMQRIIDDLNELQRREVYLSNILTLLNDINRRHSEIKSLFTTNVDIGPDTTPGAELANLVEFEIEFNANTAYFTERVARFKEAIAATKCLLPKDSYAVYANYEADSASTSTSNVTKHDVEEPSAGGSSSSSGPAKATAARPEVNREHLGLAFSLLPKGVQEDE